MDMYVGMLLCRINVCMYHGQMIRKNEVNDELEENNCNNLMLTEMRMVQPAEKIL